MAPFTQEDFACRSEWGIDAFTALAPADVIIVVDAFSFTTCVDVAVSRGVAISPVPGTIRLPPTSPPRVRNWRESGGRRDIRWRRRPIWTRRPACDACWRRRMARA